MRKKGCIILAFITILFGGITIYFQFLKPILKEEKSENKVHVEEKPAPKLQIVNEESKTRPYAIMINNNKAAWSNHSGLQDAYLIYEMITEGGITRLMALYKDKTTERIGSVRSSRHYFLDYALENDAIYVHFGWSPKAQNDIKNLGIQNINGLYDDGFWRDRTLGVAYEHTAYTNISKINDISLKKGYRMKSDSSLLLQYSIPEIYVKEKEGAILATSVTIPYSKTHITSYRFDPETKMYLRYMNEIPHIDGITKEHYKVKNIIIQQVENVSMDSYGRQDLKNIGTGRGYYITNGYAISITWNKKSRSEKTIYQYLDGTEIKVNDGNTYIQIEPISMTPTFS